MTAIKIEKDIPIPTKGRGRPMKSGYPFAEMKQGDSIFVPCKDKKTKGRVTSAAAMFSKRHGVKFTIRTVDGGVRIWLIAIPAKKPVALEAA